MSTNRSITASNRVPHPACSPVSVQQAAVFQRSLRIDEASPSGLVWKQDSKGIAKTFRPAGAVAGSQNNRGVWRVGISGKAWACSVVIRAIRALQDAQQSAKGA
ncbi:hypothetical protein Q3V30_22615 (plasmid) [Erwinia pyri]|uniref:Uncharacterized protein n=1 Tax=Erwinia pyri TaxID=3062598 RepID=A0AA50HNN1_9GAMM|nr:hypothetical protein [Erwinia sp. DE2]WLS81258.1 hypothetical protein Q3V30_22615 [Erwinia sp. DE2]